MALSPNGSPGHHYPQSGEGCPSQTEMMNLFKHWMVPTHLGEDYVLGHFYPDLFQTFSQIHLKWWCTSECQSGAL